MQRRQGSITDGHERLDYWQRRSDLKYYRTAVRYARLFAPRARSVLDVGSANCEYINWLDWIPSRTRLDLQPLGELEGVETIRGDFMQFDPARTFDLVLCLQVLEHLHQPEVFTRKLLAQGKVVIISVPYKWKPRPRSSHVQDPVDEEKLLSWTGRPWLKMDITKGRTTSANRRLVAAFKGDACSRLQALELRWRAMR